MSDRETLRLSRVTAWYALGHFAVDLACIATMAGAVTPALGMTGYRSMVLVTLVYDLVAFGVQLPLGAVLDIVGRASSCRLTLVSLGLVATGVVVARVPGLAVAWAATLLVGLGNALYHCEGGIEVLGESQGRPGPAGVFISTGAAGVFMGGVAAFFEWPATPYVLLMLLALCAGGFARMGASSTVCSGLNYVLPGRQWAAVLCFAASIAVRNYATLVMAFPWKAGVSYGACVVAAVVLGKAAGGFAKGWLGSWRASVLSLGGGALLLYAGWEHMGVALVGVFLFHLTMAIALVEIAALLPRSQGLAFGIAWFSLLVGGVPVVVGMRVTSAGLLAFYSLATLALMLGGLALAKHHKGVDAE